MLKKRIATAVILAPIVLFIIGFGNTLMFSLFVGFLALMIGFEWFQIVNKNTINSVILSISIAILVVTIQYASFLKIDAKSLLMASTIIWSIALLWLFTPHKGKNNSLIKYALGCGILLFFGTAIISLYQVPKLGIKLTFALFLLIWIADIGAFVAGKTFGKHKLAPKVSPGKTIEGLLGGLVFSSLFGVFVAHYLSLDWRYFLVAFPMLAIISVIGDLFASLLKRQAQVKDSGFMLPGHGGFLDRFDSLIAAAPFYFAFVALMIL